jgi:putative tricarboxylic transport membrane protein
MRREQRVALGLGLFAIIYMVGAWRLPRFALATGVVDAHIFPLVLGALLLVLSVIYYVQAGAKPDGKPLLDGVNLPLLLKLMGATIAYALLLGRLGFVVATSIFLTGTMALLGSRKWGRTISIGVGFSVGVYVIFVYVLKVSLARGILPF